MNEKSSSLALISASCLHIWFVWYQGVAECKCATIKELCSLLQFQFFLEGVPKVAWRQHDMTQMKIFHMLLGR
jgi:hypothetical protein